MNAFTQAIWEVLDESLDEDSELRADLQRLLFKEYKPFLTPLQAQEAHCHSLKTYILDKLNSWIEWLPDTIFNQLGSELVQAALAEVDWSALAAQLQGRLSERERHYART